MAFQLRILLIDDNPTDTHLLQEVVQELGLPCALTVTHSGRGALTQLQAQGPKRPDLVLLDLQMPDLNGLSVLKQVRAHPEWSSLPVVMLSDSDNPTDIQDCYAAGANAYHRKSPDFTHLVEALRLTVTYWSLVIQAPLAR